MPINPTKVRLRSCRIRGVDVRLMTNKISVYESMCKPYITSIVTIIDNNNLINGLGLRGGEEIRFAFDGGGHVYEATHYISTIKGEKSAENKRAMVYTINAISPSFFYDRANLVQRSDVNIPGTAAISAIFGEYLSGDRPLNIFPSLGMIAKSDIGGFVTQNKKPFTAINDIMKQISFGGFKSGSPVFFLNQYEYVVAPLEQLLASVSAQATFEERSTWGSDWRHTFNTTHVVIDAATHDEDNEEASGRGGAMNIAAAATGALNLFDIAKGAEAVPAMFGQIGGSFGGLGEAASGGIQKFVRGKLGGIQNVLQMDSRRNEPSNDQGMNAVAENSFQAQVKDGVNYLIKVPIQGGINCTVGRGINAKLIPPHGDQQRGHNRVGGLMIVADLCHECYFDNREVQATTTFRGVKTGFNV